MCGILGVLPSVDEKDFSKALDLIAHRGPDGYGIWSDDGYITLGHRRLAILDTSEIASQPMEYMGRYNIIFNGEIYNFLEIRRELEKLGYSFLSNSDTEVLLAAFVEWGELCLRKLNGMWAFVIWDSIEKSLFISRDRMGEKPLFYYYSNTQFCFSSEQKALLPFLPEVKASGNFHSLIKDPYAYESTGKSLFQGLLRFPAGHYGWLKNGRFTVSRYWSTVDEKPDIPSKYDDQVAYLRELLIDSCRLRMRADVSIGTGLSGGIDSSAVAAAISKVAKQSASDRISNDWQNAFVASFPNSVMNESQHAQTVAGHLGINIHTVAIDPAAHIKDLEHWVYLFEEVHEVNPIPHIMLYKKMRENGVIVSLDGHGGDELFCGYESSILHAVPDALRSGSIKSVNEVFETYHDCHPRNDYFRGMTKFQSSLYLMRAKLRLLLSKGVKLSDLANANYGSLNAHLHQLSFKTILPTLLRNYDHYSMISGVEIRIPLLDYRIVDFAFSIPWSSKVRNGYSKSVLRDAVAPWLPESIVRRKDKIGFAPPIQSWMRGALKEYLMDEISSQKFKDANLINPSELGAAINSIVTGSGSITLYSAEKIWKNFMVYLWEKAFLKEKVWKIN